MNASLRRRLLSEWIRLPVPSHLPVDPSNLHLVFQKAFSRLGLGNRFQETALLENWPGIVGPTLAAHCHPQCIQRGVLRLLVDHPAWLHQISMVHKANIIRMVQQRFPHLKINDVHLRIG